MPGTFALPAGPASPTAARARPPPPRACRTPRPRQCQVRRACREAAPPGVAEPNCSGLGGPASVPDRVRNTKLTYPIPPRISPRHAAPADGRGEQNPRGAPAGGWPQGPQAARPLAAGCIGGRQRYRKLWPIPRESFDKRATEQTVTRAAARRRATRRNAWAQDIAASARPSRRRRCLTPASAGPPPLLVAGCHEQTSGGALSRRATAVLGVTAAQHPGTPAYRTVRGRPGWPAGPAPWPWEPACLSGVPGDEFLRALMPDRPSAAAGRPCRAY